MNQHNELMDIEKRMTAGVIGKMVENVALNQPEVQRALARGAVIGPYILQGVVYENGIGLWEPMQEAPDGPRT